MADVRYDPLIIQKFANTLYAQARSILTMCLLLGVLFGASAWIAVAHSSNHVVGAILFALCLVVAYMVGNALGFRYKLQAQIALCQVQTEMNTRPSLRVSATGA